MHRMSHQRPQLQVWRFPRLAAAFLLTLPLPLAAAAQERLIFGNPEHFCRIGAFPGGGEYSGPQPTFQLAQVSGPSRVPLHFLRDDDGSGTAGRCPRPDKAACKQNEVVNAGDRVILSKILRGYACSWYQPRRGRARVGWLPLNRLTILAPAPNPPLDHWLGTWRALGEPLTLRRGHKPGEIQVNGSAYWPGPNLPNTHFGLLQGRAAPVNNTLVIEDPSEPEPYRCRARLTRIGDWLVVSDNHHCGGLNVTFDGVYQLQGS